jgi:hypothetical protein
MSVRGCSLWSTLVVSIGPAVNKISTQLRYEDFDLRSSSTPGLRPLIHVSPPVFAGGSREPRQQVNVQVRHSVTPHGRVDMVSPGYFAECPARTRAPQADPLGLSVGQIGQPRCMSQRLYKQMPQIGDCAITSQYIRRDGMSDEDQIIFRNRSARHERSTIAVLSAYEAVCYGVAFGHIRNLCTHMSWYRPAARSVQTGPTRLTGLPRTTMHGGELQPRLQPRGSSQPRSSMRGAD